ncbi:MAG: AMP-binding protein, partial [Candidatus Rokubacteria bacterium]|nr:AMP-binding protein [Candidatus Rokubacteria bacterium]
MSAAEPDTLPKLLLHQAARYGARKVAIREKDRGIWRPYTWADAAEHVRAFALGLAALGFRRGDALSVIGDNRPRLYWAQLAAQALGGIPVPLFQDSIARELQYVLDHAEVKVVVAEDQEQVDKIRGLQGELPHLRQIVFDDARGLGGDRDPSLLAFERVEALGREFGRARPGYVEAEVARGAAGDTALICYTSGTTGHPKGVMLSHRNLIANLDAFLAVERYRDTDELLAYLPMAWIGEVIYSLVGQLLVGYTINCPEAPETVQRDLRELGPTVLLAPPRIWEAMLTTVQVKIEDSDRVKRALYRGAMAVAARILARRAAGQRVPLSLRLLYALGEVVAYGPIRDQLGLGRVRYAYTGGAALGPEIFQFFRGIGLNLKQIYGLTETSAACVVQPDGEVKPESVGRPAPGVEVRISERGEILIRGPGVFQGYYKNEEATREVLEDGWFRTGDAGFFDPDGHLVVIDRAKDLGSLADGTPFAPQFIETKLKFSPDLREAVAVGHGRPYV